MRKSMIERAAILGLALWFAVLTAVVQGPHRHPVSGHPDGTHPAHTSCAASKIDCAAGSSTGQVLAGEASSWQAQVDPDHCSACLFLKNCKERAIAFKSFIPIPTPLNHIAQIQDHKNSSPVVDSACPRAPPLAIA
jgi:hypothetical protein